MTRPGDDAPWRDLRALEPSAGSKDRVLGAVQATVRQQGSWRRPLTIALPLAAVAVLALAWTVADSRGPTPAPVTAGHATDGATAEAGAARPPVAAVPSPAPVMPPALVAEAHPSNAEAPAEPARAVTLRRGDRVTYALEAAEVIAHGPARVRLSADAVELSEGTLIVRGTANLRGGTCQARVSGRATVVAREAELQVQVFAGSVEVEPASTGCAISYRDSRELPPPAALATDDRLRRQVDAYRAARALRGLDDERALASWRDFVRQWPGSPLRAEADAAIAETLAALGRIEEARAAAGAFLEAHPDHALAPRVRRAVGEEPR